MPPALAAGAGEVRDPHYGDTLFEFFQDHYFSAITGLMVSQHFGRVSHHAEDAEVLRGGMLLSYGMHQQAGEIFARLIDVGAKPATRDRAWYFLAKIRFQRGYISQAQDALSRIGNDLPPELQEEYGLLQSQVQMALGDYRGAAARLSSMDTNAPGARYVKFNLGVALLKSGEPQRGAQVLDELGRAPAESEEYRDLRDRANVALGFSALTTREFPAAANYLERVRLQSLQANKALLGLGWAALSQKQPRRALVPWLELGQRDIGDAAVLEATIAAPYAYAELGALRQSSRGYEQAIDAFARETTALDESIAAVRTGRLLQALANSNPGQEMGWFWSLRVAPDLPHAGHLTHVLAQHDFQEALKNYRDLLFLARNLQDWRDKLGVFDDILSNRRQSFAQRLPQIQERAAVLGSGQPLREQLQRLSATVAQAEADADGVAFADARQQDMLQRLASVRATLGRSGSTAEIDAARERARLAGGLLTWQLAQDYPERSWQARRDLQAARDGLASAQRLADALVQAQRDEPARLDAFAQRIAALGPLLQAQSVRVADLGAAQKEALQNLAVASLQRQQENIAAYATQARFALAQLYDRGTAAAAGATAQPDAEAANAAKP